MEKNIKEKHIDEIKNLIQKHTGTSWATAEKAAYFLYEYFKAGEDCELIKNKLDFYRIQTDKVRQLIFSRNDIGEPCQPLYDAIFDKIVTQEKEIERLNKLLSTHVKRRYCEGEVYELLNKAIISSKDKSFSTLVEWWDKNKKLPDDIEVVFSLSDVLEIAENFHSFGLADCISINNGEETATPDKQQYFKKKFNITV